MADCYKTSVFFSELGRMCTSISKRNAENCSHCGMYDLKLESESCGNALWDYREEVVRIVQKWSDDHPLPKPKTYADVFFEHFPTASKDDACMPFICRKNIFGTGYGGCNYAGYDCRACWNEPYPEQEASNE